MLSCLSQIFSDWWSFFPQVSSPAQGRDRPPCHDPWRSHGTSLGLHICSSVRSIHLTEVKLLMVQKSGDHQLRLVVEIYHYLQGFIHPRWLFGISEPSTVSIYSPIHSTGTTSFKLSPFCCNDFKLRSVRFSASNHPCKQMLIQSKACPENGSSSLLFQTQEDWGLSGLQNFIS